MAKSATIESSREQLLSGLQKIVGKSHVLTSPRSTRNYTRGFRYGGGPVAAVARPGSLVEMWRVLNIAVGAGCAVILQAANTGLTGGSTPWGEDYDREIILISVTRLKGIHPILRGEQVVCLPGATLDGLEKQLRPLGREPHSVIGSSCIGASVLGGICNNSGGALIHRGPAYTEMSLFAEIRDDSAIALRRDDRDWVEQLPTDLDAKLEKKLYYGHFFCHVFHQDYVVRKGHDCLSVEHDMWRLLDQRGAEYPAEHNVGHLYNAKPGLKDFYRSIDPTNTLNPGIGQTSKRAHWQ